MTTSSAFTAAFFLLLSGCTFFPDPNRTALKERQSYAKRIAALQAEPGLTDDERSTLDQLSSVVSTGQRFNGTQADGILYAIRHSLDTRSVLSAGAQLEKSRKEKYLSKHPHTPSATRELITRGKVAVGMTAAEAVASWGEPISRTRAQGSGEQWVYRGNTFLYLDSGKVVSIQTLRRGN